VSRALLTACSTRSGTVKLHSIVQAANGGRDHVLHLDRLGVANRDLIPGLVNHAGEFLRLETVGLRRRNRRLRGYRRRGGHQHQPNAAIPTMNPSGVSALR